MGRGVDEGMAVPLAGSVGRAVAEAVGCSKKGIRVGVPSDGKSGGCPRISLVETANKLLRVGVSTGETVSVSVVDNPEQATVVQSKRKLRITIFKGNLPFTLRKATLMLSLISVHSKIPGFS